MTARLTTALLSIMLAGCAPGSSWFAASGTDVTLDYVPGAAPGDPPTIQAHIVDRTDRTEGIEVEYTRTDTGVNVKVTTGGKSSSAVTEQDRAMAEALMRIAVEIAQEAAVGTLP